MAISAAVDASLRVLRVAQKLGVKRVVLTGSIASMMASMKTGTFGPSDWTNIEAPDVNTQAKSKTLTEKAAWDFINGQEGDAPMELTVMAPGVVFGPPLGSNISGQSLSLMDQILRGKVPMVPNGAFPMVDVRDVRNCMCKHSRYLRQQANGLSFQERNQLASPAWRSS